MTAEFDLPDGNKGVVAKLTAKLFGSEGDEMDIAAQLAGCENILWQYGQDGLAGHKPDTWRSDLENWLSQITRATHFWDFYGSGKDTARQLATAMGEVILAAAAIGQDRDAKLFSVHLNVAIAAYSGALGVPPTTPIDSWEVPSVTWDQDQTLTKRLRLVNEYLNDVEQLLSGEERRALGMVRSGLSDLVEPGENRILLGLLKFRVQLPVAVVLEGEGAAKGAGRAYLLTVEWFDRREGKALLVRNPAALGCSVLDQQFGQAEHAAWAIALGQKLFRERGFIRWGTDMEPGPEVVVIGGPSAGGALATALVSLGEKRRPVRALVLGRLAQNEGESTTPDAAGRLYEVGGVADKAMAAASSETLRVSRLVLWQTEPNAADPPEIRADIEFLQQEYKNLTIQRLRDVREVVGQLSNRWIRVGEWFRIHPRIEWAGLLGVLSLLLVAAIWGVRADSSYRDIKRIASLVQQYESDLELEEWPLDHMNDLLEAIARDDVETAHVNWIKFADKLRVRIETNPHLKKDDVNRYQAALRFLDNRDSNLAETVRAVLEARRTHLQLQWELPREDIQTVFGPGTATVENGLLVLAKKDKPATRIATLGKCGAGGAQLEAKYDNSWLDASRLELEVNANVTGEKSGYVFSLCTVENGPPSGRETFREARSKGGRIELGISRDNILLHIETRDAGHLPGDTLTMTAMREGSLLILQVGDLQPLVFEDLFALSGKESEVGHFALHWPKDVRLVTLKGYVVMQPQKLSPLEEGDQSYAEGKYADALNAYKDQAQRANKPDVDQEVRYKQGLCLVAQGENERAKEIFKNLGYENGKPWPLYACVQLWNLYILQDQMDLADELLDNHIAQQEQLDNSTLVRRVPDRTRWHILTKYRDVVAILQGQKVNHNQRINAARRWVAVEELLKGNSAESKIWLGWAYYLGGFPNEAVKELSALYEQSPTLHLLGEYVWLLRKTKSAPDALKVVQQAEQQYKGPDLLFLALLKAECATVEQWDQVELELAQKVRGPGSRRHLCQAWLMIGFMRERRGDRPGAEKAWHEACQYAEQPTDRSDLLYFLISRSLAGLSDQTDAKAFLERAFNAQLGSTLARSVILLLEEENLVKVAGEMWRTREGRELARQLVFRDHILAEQFSKPPTLAIFEYARQKAFGNSEDPEQLRVCWQVAESIFHHAVEAPNRELIALGFSAIPAWKGKDSSGATEKLIAALPQSDRAPAAYVAAHRMLQLKLFNEALHFFNLSLKLVQKNDQHLTNLIDADRNLFDAKKGRLIIRCDGLRKVSLILRGDQGVTIKELANHEILDLEIGRYRVELGKDAGDLSCFPSEINLTRCGRVTIHIEHRLPATSVVEPLPGLVPMPAP